MTGAEIVVTAFAAGLEACQSILLSDRFQLFATTGQNLMNVCLVTDIPGDNIPGRIKYPVQSQREFHNTETGCEMATGLSYHLDNVFPYLLSQLNQLRHSQRSYIFRLIYIL